MPYPEELLRCAFDIADLHPRLSDQACLRRALSTAYYALFHLLISDGVVGCVDPRLQLTIARLFNHGSMKQASDEVVAELSKYFSQKPPEGPERTLKYHLHQVADTFTQAQYNRIEADYNLQREWRSTEVLLALDSIAAAFESWSLIRTEPQARDYLAAMLPSRERRPNERSRAKIRPTLSDAPPSSSEGD